jgi:hypothetical protein
MFTPGQLRPAFVNHCCANCFKSSRVRAILSALEVFHISRCITVLAFCFGVGLLPANSPAAEFQKFVAPTNSVLDAQLRKALRQAGYPSATSCRPCHTQVYDEWRLSAHAYASISPMFHKFEQKINDLSQGTVGTFCLRCHATVGTSLGERRELALWERTEVSREGVTCVTCHRINEEYGRVNGERRIVPGEIDSCCENGFLFVEAIKASDNLSMRFWL